MKLYKGFVGFPQNRVTKKSGQVTPKNQGQKKWELMLQGAHILDLALCYMIDQKGTEGTKRTHTCPSPVLCDRPTQCSSSTWGYALHVFPQEKKKKCTPARLEKKIAFECLPFPSQICFGPIGEDSGRTPADIVERQKNKIRALVFFFTSVTDNACQKRFFVPSVIGKYTVLLS